MTALPAGHYQGSLGRYDAKPSMAGAAMRGLAKHGALRGIGLRGLGQGVDFCDSGWSAVNALIAGAGQVITAANQSSASSGGEDASPDRGWAAVGAGTSLLGSSWGTHCTQRAQAEAQAQQTAFEQSLAQQRLQNESSIAQARMQAEMQMAALAAQRRNGAAPAISNQTLLIGAGVLGAVVLAAVLLRR